MSQQYFTILTTIGRKKLHKALTKGEQLHLTDMAVGDGNGKPIRPREKMKSLVNEVYRAPINNKTADPNNPSWAVLNLILPVDVGGWYVREAGIYDADGDLIFVGSLPENYKALPSQGIASDLAINMVVDIQRADSVTLTIDPATVLASQDWVGTQIETRMQSHDDDPEAHAALVERLRESGGLIPAGGMETAVREVLSQHGREILVESGLVREKLTGPLSLYVETDGDDANDGLSVDSAFKTLQAALDRASGYDAGQYGITIQVGAGRFEAIPFIYGSALQTACSRNVPLTFQGAGWGETILTGQWGMYSVPNMAFTDLTLSGQQNVADGTSLWMQRVRFLGAGQTALNVYRSANVTFQDECLVEGDFAAPVFRASGSASIYSSKRLIINGPVTANYFVLVEINGCISLRGEIENPELVTARRWLVQTGGLLVHPGDDPDAYFPGNQAGLLIDNMATEPALLALKNHAADADLHAGIVNPELASRAIKDALAQSGREILVESGLVRDKLSEKLTLYVETNGDDANDGYSPATAKATIRGALDALAGVDAGKFTVTVRLGEGEFTAPGTVMNGFVPSSGSPGKTLDFIGAGKDKTTVTGQWNFYFIPYTGYYDLALKGQVIVADSTPLAMYRVRFIGNGESALNVYRGGGVTFHSECEVQGDFGPVVFKSSLYATIASNYPVRIVGPVKAEYFVCAVEGGTIHLRAGFVGAEQVVGRRWLTRSGGSLSHGTTDPDEYFPGDQPGIADNGGFTDAVSRDLATHMANPAAHGNRIEMVDKPLTFYIRQDGNDANDGLSQTTAKRTLTAAFRELPYYTAGSDITDLDLGEGSFNEPEGFHVPRTRSIGHGVLRVVGKGKDKTQIGGNELLFKIYGVDFRIIELELQGNIYASEQAFVVLGNVTMDPSLISDSYVYAQRGAVFWLLDSLDVKGNGKRFLYARTGAHIHCQAQVNFVDTPTFTTSIVDAIQGTIMWDNRSTGTATGIRYRETFPGAVFTNYYNPNTFLAGTEDGYVFPLR